MYKQEKDNEKKKRFKIGRWRGLIAKPLESNLN